MQHADTLGWTWLIVFGAMHVGALVGMIVTRVGRRRGSGQGACVEFGRAWPSAMGEGAYRSTMAAESPDNAFSLRRGESSSFLSAAYLLVLVLCAGVMFLQRSVEVALACAVFLCLPILMMLAHKPRVLEMDAVGLTVHRWLGMRRVRWSDVHVGFVQTRGVALVSEEERVLLSVSLSADSVQCLVRKLDTMMRGTPTWPEWAPPPPLRPAFPWQSAPPDLVLEEVRYEYGEARGSLEDIAELRWGSKLRLVDDAGETRLILPLQVAARHYAQIVQALAAARPSERGLRWSRWRAVASPKQWVLNAALFLVILPGLFSWPGVLLLIFASALVVSSLYWREHLVEVGVDGVELWSLRHGQRAFPWSRIDGLSLCGDVGEPIFQIDGSPMQVHLPDYGPETLRKVLAIGRSELLHPGPQYVRYTRECPEI